MLNKIYKILIVFTLTVFVIACEREYTPVDLNTEPEIVVEGHIEAGDNAFPTYVILTKTVSFFENFDPNKLDNFFVNGAEVSVSDGSKSFNLQELCLDKLNPAQKLIAAQAFGLNPDSLQNIKLCIYLDLTGQLKGIEGKKYDLSIKAGSKTITASTVIPKIVAVDSFVFNKTFQNAYPDYRELGGYLTDPDGYNAYRLFAKVNKGNFVANARGSVVDDGIFDGKKSFRFQYSNPVRRVIPKNETADEKKKYQGTGGLWRVGDTVSIKWCNIDKAHYEFWNTLEAARNNQGPFSSYTKVTSNINGGLGIWGAYSVKQYNMIVK